MRLDTSKRAARAQYDANVRFAEQYQPRCRGGVGPRVLVTGFGRFMNISDNATGRMVSALVPAARYPETVPVAAGEVDPPASQLSVGSAVLDLPQSGAVNVCAMILPVYWDLAAILIAKEIEAFEPDVVLMNGVAGAAQPMWFELGASNRAQPSQDGSGNVRPVSQAGGVVRVLEQDTEDARPMFAPWFPMQAAASAALRAQANVLEGDKAFSQVVTGTRLASFPRASSSYICNNVSYVTNYVLDHPGETVQLMQASAEVVGAKNSVPITIRGDHRNVVREFIHWPSGLRGKHVLGGREVLRAVIDAAVFRREESKRGDNRDASESLTGGDTF